MPAPREVCLSVRVRVPRGTPWGQVESVLDEAILGVTAEFDDWDVSNMVTVEVRDLPNGESVHHKHLPGEHDG